MRSVACLAVLFLAPLSDAIAQGQPTLEPGQRVRLTCPQAGLDNAKADVLAIRGDTLVLQHERLRADARGRWTVDSAVTPVMLVDLTKLEVHVGRHRSAVRAVGFGTIGLLGGTVVGCVALYGASDYQGDDKGLECALGGLIGGVVGGVVGTLMGASSRDRWEEVPLDRLRVRPVAYPDGFGIGVSIRF